MLLPTGSIRSGAGKSRGKGKGKGKGWIRWVLPSTLPQARTPGRQVVSSCLRRGEKSCVSIACWASHLLRSALLDDFVASEEAQLQMPSNITGLERKFLHEQVGALVICEVFEEPSIVLRRRSGSSPRSPLGRAKTETRGKEIYTV